MYEDDFLYCVYVPPNSIIAADQWGFANVHWYKFSVPFPSQLFSPEFQNSFQSFWGSAANTYYFNNQVTATIFSKLFGMPSQPGIIYRESNPQLFFPVH